MVRSNTPKKANGEGTLYERKDGRWEARLTVDTPTGRKRLTVTKREKSEAKKWLNQVKYNQDKGKLFSLEAERLTFGEYLDRWLEDVVKGSVSRHTYRDYEGKVRLHLKPDLGKIRLKALTSLHLQSLYQRKVGEGLSPRTVGYIHSTARTALAQAEEWDLVPKNAARHARPPKKKEKEYRTLTVPEIERLFEAAAGDRLEAVYVLALTTGLRRGELLGLKWGDVDLDRATLSVNRSLDTLYGPIQEKSPKRKSSRRSISLLPEAVTALRLHRTRQAEEKLSVGPVWADHGYLFPTRIGTPMRGDNLLKRSLRPLLELAGLPPLTFHELRHTFATLHLSTGERPKVVQEILGHSSIRTTMDTYSHVIPGMQEEAAKRLQDLLFGSRNGAVTGNVAGNPPEAPDDAETKVEKPPANEGF